MLQNGTILAEKYQILEVIGRGGMSVVYRAKNLENDGMLAVKEVNRTSGDGAQTVIQSLTAEGRLLKRLDNPSLPHIYEIIEEQNTIMLVMDFIEGKSLDKVIRETGPIDEKSIIDWSMQVCQVLDYLHHQSPPIIYRDMKPANIILQPDKTIKMIDFGTARTQKLGVVMSSDTICIGTEGFAAPEQFGGMSQSDARTDVFCLGATIYNMLTGHSPCDRPKGILPMEYWGEAIANSPLSYIISKCTRNDPNERYQSAMELYEDLRLAAAGQLKSKGARGTSGLLHRAGWQKLTPKGAGGTGDLSGLLGKGKNRQTREAETGKAEPTANQFVNAHVPQTERQEPTVHTDWQEPQVHTDWQEPQAQDDGQAAASPWRLVLLIAGPVTVLLLLLGGLMLFLGASLLGTLVLIFAFAAMALTGISAWCYSKNK